MATGKRATAAMPLQHKGDDVPGRIAEMAERVKGGDFLGADAVGGEASYPLAIPKAALKYGRQLFDGPAATVHEAFYCPPPLAGTLEGAVGPEPVPVAVKRVKNRQDEDLPRFRNEVRAGVCCTLR